MSDTRNTMLKEVCKLQGELNELINKMLEIRKTNSLFTDPRVDELTNRIKTLQTQIQNIDKANGHNISISNPGFTATRK